MSETSVDRARLRELADMAERECCGMPDFRGPGCEAECCGQYERPVRVDADVVLALLDELEKVERERDGLLSIEAARVGVWLQQAQP